MASANNAVAMALHPFTPDVLDLVPCPNCKKTTRYKGNPHRPFCSERCKKIDLGEWATEGYVVPDKSSEVEEDNVSTTQDSPYSQNEGGE